MFPPLLPLPWPASPAEAVCPLWLQLPSGRRSPVPASNSSLFLQPRDDKTIPAVANLWVASPSLEWLPSSSFTFMANFLDEIPSDLNT